MAVTRGATTSLFTTSSSTTDASITHTVDSGTTLLVVTIGLEGTIGLSGTPEWQPDGAANQGMTLIAQTDNTGLNNNDTRLFTYGLVSPTADTGTVAITLATANDCPWASATNYIGTETASVAAATNTLEQVVNPSAAETGDCVFASAGTAGNCLYVSANSKGGDTDPASNDASFNEIHDTATGTNVTADLALYIADLLNASAATAVTVTFTAVDATSGQYIEIVASSGGSIIPQIMHHRRMMQ